MTQITGDVMMRDPVAVERREGTSEEGSGCALADVSAAEGHT